MDYTIMQHLGCPACEGMPELPSGNVLLIVGQTCKVGLSLDGKVLTIDLREVEYAFGKEFPEDFVKIKQLWEEHLQRADEFDEQILGDY